ncbi:hydrocephalus-inducing protein-like [Poecile atricapillus]|uniref:hydrocephalus-inducing protein-like n=1 Tax=Poecile atricapillus TaxID=48891 RepID=UPI002739334C|nr:hydrocephalus-inducing protein-like [Poecile atricapillus]
MEARGTGRARGYLGTAAAAPAALLFQLQLRGDRDPRFPREKLNKNEASAGESSLPRIGPFLPTSETGQKQLLSSSEQRWLSYCFPSVAWADVLTQSLSFTGDQKLVFQNFVAHEVSEMELSLTNESKCVQLVQVSMQSSPCFRLVCPNEAYRAVPRGATARVRIQFTPNESKDYSHELVCMTKTERIVVPIRAIAARAILNIPDQLNFSECPVKSSTKRTLLLRNTGSLEAHYYISTQSPFSVVPAMGALGAGDSVQVTVGFHPLTTGAHFGSMVVSYNTGEEMIHTNLQGEAVDVSIGLRTYSVELKKTFITTSSHTTMFIENRSNIRAQFQWKTFPSEEDENEEKRRQCYLLRSPREASVDNTTEERRRAKKKGSCEDRRAILKSSVREKMMKLKEDPMLFSSDAFSLEPLEGEIEPNSSVQIKVTFKPLKAREYRSVAYCNISGRGSRLPLHLRGEGQGPVVEFSRQMLKLGNISVNTSHVYEVKLMNRGAIDAPFTYIPSATNVGCCFKFAPEEGVIAAGGIRTIHISFNATVLGSFEEQFQFRVAASPTPVTLTVWGCVTGPALHFDLHELHFGDISFGFPRTMTCRLTNTSPVAVTFKLRMSDDGTQPAVSSLDQICKDSDPSWRKGIHFYVEPREFTMNPSQGTILPQGHQDIEVTLCSNTVMEYYRKMLVDLVGLEGVGKEVASLIITARCLVPELQVYPQIMRCNQCHLKEPYEKKFIITNKTDLPGCYGLIPQKRKEDSPVLYSSPKPCGIVQPHSTAEIPVTIEVQTLGDHRTNVLIGVFGDERNPLRAELLSSGELAEIYGTPKKIDFGMIPPLQPSSQTLTLFNKGLVPVDFRIKIAEKPQCFVLETEEGVIPARGEVPVTVTAILDDTGHFADSIQLFIGNSFCFSFLLRAMGTGTTIVTDKPLAPELNLGYQFSHLPSTHQFQVTNRGHHFHRLFWSVECWRPPKKKGQSVSALSSPKAEDDLEPPGRTSAVFGLEPGSWELQPGESVDMVLRGFSHTPQEVRDYMKCEAVVGTSVVTKKIIETIISCKFIDPSIEVSARKLSFRVEKKPSDVLTLQYQPLALKNTCSLPLHLVLDVEQPFLVCDEEQQPLPDGQPVTVGVEETCHVYIAFDPAYKLELNSWQEKKILKIDMVRDHPNVEHIELWGEVHFPNLQIQPSSLEFGCIVAGTEAVRSLRMSNCSPLPVEYHWSFQADSQVHKFRHYIPVGLAGFSHSVDVPWTPLKVEKAFSILPLSGVLQPGERQQVSFTFTGHLNTMAHVTALCHVEGGPTYEVKLSGEASRVSYSLSAREINCGSQMFNEVHHSTVILANTSKIKFHWVLEPSTADQDLPGVFLVKPTTGSIACGRKQVLRFSYMPGVPGAFSRTYQLKVGDLEPEKICLKGEASFPMISVNLPWNIKGNEKCGKPLRLAEHTQQYSETLKIQIPAAQPLKSPDVKTGKLKPCMLEGSDIVANTRLQIKMIEKAALELQKKLTSHPPKTEFPDKKLCQSLVKVELPEYVLDMGTVLKGFTERRTLEITNPGQIPVSFWVDASVLQDTGFSVDLGQMKSLPHMHTLRFDVHFESAQQPQGDVDVLLPIQVTKGPTSHIRLRATVLELSLDLSQNTLHFPNVLVGQCQVETVQLYNGFQVPCKWFITAIKPVTKSNQLRYLTRAQGQKQQALEEGRCPFEVTPSKGTLDAGAWQNLQIQFAPKEERSYKYELKLNIHGSSNHLRLHLSGQGLEPRLEFSPPALKMGWVLVDSDGVEATVVVKNPCKFPIEFYCLDLDEQYLEEEKARTPDEKGSSAEGQPKTGKAVSRDKSPKGNQISTERTESPWESSSTRSKSTLEGASIPTEFLRLKRYRWTVPALGEVELKVHFSTKKPGKFEQTLRFELVGTKRQYELPCSGTGLYPSISQNPRLVFPQWRKTMKEGEIIFKEYVESTKQFHFGPLLCGKSREWYKAQNCPGNSENITILNNSPVDVEVQFSFEDDEKAETFLLDPPSMTLKPKKKQELTIWAYPTSPGFLEDKLICCINKNPEPVVFSLCCHGVHVKLEVSPLELSFGKLLLHRTDSRTLVLKNNTLLPMAWQLSGLDDLVEDFSLSQDNGTIDPRSEIEVTVNFKAQQIGTIEKSLRLEVSDTENILGIVQVENIKLSAEVYDVLLSMVLPEDETLDFGTINVQDNVKNILTLTNKGMYNIEYRLMLKGAGPRMRDLASHFTVKPQSGKLIASQPGVNIEIFFHPTREILLKNSPILYCQVIDAISGEGGQTVASIPVRVSARAAYSKFSIEPASPISFGAMMKGSKKSQTVVLENTGVISFKFRIHRATEDESPLESKSSKQGESVPSARKCSAGRKSSLTQPLLELLLQGQLNVGMFTVSPCSGSIAPWGQQQITVECLAGQEGTCEEQLYIDIVGRDPRDNPLGIPFTLTAESCLPAFAEDAMLIFEEYPICSSTDLSHKLLSVHGVGLFVRDDNKFIFNKILVGQEAEAHFNIYNTTGLPCDVVLSINPLPGQEKGPITVFKLHPVQMSIPGSSHAVATVTFTPPDEQNYDCTFKASLVIPKRSVKIKPQTLSFTISGRGHEPQVTVVCPRARSKRGNAVLRFQRLQLGDLEMLPLVVRNNGIVPVKFMLHLEDEHGAFFLKARRSTLERFHTEDVGEDSVGNESKPPKKPLLLLHRGQSAEFDVIFDPTLARRVEGKIRVLVGDTYSDKTLIELVGEGHKDEFTLNCLEEDPQLRNDKSSWNKDIIDAVRLNHIQFGDCPVGKPCHRTFTITNHTGMTFMRFEWEADVPFQFCPRVGHLHPGCTKAITVTLKSDVPATFRRHLVKCKVTKIKFELPPWKVPDWDDEMCIVLWNDITGKEPAAQWPEKEKTVETVPEPAHTVLKKSGQEAELYLSALVAYAQFKLDTVVVQLKDTLPFQTRTATFRMHNTGKVALEYFWEEAAPADSEAVRMPYSTTLMSRLSSAPVVRQRRKLVLRFRREQDHPFETHPSELRRLQWLAKEQQDSEQEQLQDSEQEQPDSDQEQLSEEEQLDAKQKQRSKKRCHSKERSLSPQRATSSLEVLPDVTHDQSLFSINPNFGTITPGQKKTFHVLFSPKDVGNFETTMQCSIPNLEQTHRTVQVVLKGRAREWKRFGKPKCSALEQTDEGQRHKKQLHWQPTPE